MVFASYEQCQICFVLLLYIITSQTYAIAVFTLDKYPSCWWTGCQLSTWAVIGCDQYNRTQQNVKECDGGSEYYCCTSDSDAQVQLVDDCWWTGCQPNNWAVKGCDSYNRTERDRTVCGVDGFRYECCGRNDTTTTANPDTRSYPDENCKWSECQPKEKSDRGCPSDTVQIGLHDCPDGDLFHCCSKKIPVDSNGQ